MVSKHTKIKFADFWGLKLLKFGTCTAPSTNIKALIIIITGKIHYI